MKWTMVRWLPAMLAGASLMMCVRADEGKSVNIEEIDKNFQSAKVDGKEVCYHDALQAPFQLTGFPWRDEKKVFNRVPVSFTTQEVSAQVLAGSQFSTGGAIRFRTDSPYLAIRAKLAHSSDLGHMPRAATSGFDFYRGAGTAIRYRSSVRPSAKQEILEVMAVPETPKEMNDWTVYLPLYGSAAKIEIGLAPGSNVEAPTPQTIARPILFYGSSITQGGCASRTGNAYTTMLCRAVDAPQINLGFSGAAKGEIAIAQAIGELDLEVFVLDYDGNAPTVAHLQATHEPFFKAVRAKQPNLPIIMMSICKFSGTPTEIARREVIRATYEHAVKAGDKNVWFIPGEALFGTEDRDACTVDGSHPNDLGFYRMYQTVLPVLKEALAARAAQRAAGAKP